MDKEVTEQHGVGGIRGHYLQQSTGIITGVWGHDFKARDTAVPGGEALTVLGSCVKRYGKHIVNEKASKEGGAVPYQHQQQHR